MTHRPSRSQRVQGGFGVPLKGPSTTVEEKYSLLLRFGLVTHCDPENGTVFVTQSDGRGGSHLPIWT